MLCRTPFCFYKLGKMWIYSAVRILRMKKKWKNFYVDGTISVKINSIPQGFILSGDRDET